VSKEESGGTPEASETVTKWSSQRPYMRATRGSHRKLFQVFNSQMWLCVRDWLCFYFSSNQSNWIGLDTVYSLLWIVTIFKFGEYGEIDGLLVGMDDKCCE
jgi:hypothetical protein